jgi:hypothetical protein
VVVVLFADEDVDFDDEEQAATSIAIATAPARSLGRIRRTVSARFATLQARACLFPDA